jgi:hypothetical protein
MKLSFETLWIQGEPAHSAARNCLRGAAAATGSNSPPQQIQFRLLHKGVKLRGNIHKNDLGSATNREHTQRCDSNHQKWLFSILNCSCHGCWCHKANTAVKDADRKMVLFNGCLITMSQHHPGAHTSGPSKHHEAPKASRHTVVRSKFAPNLLIFSCPNE